MRDLTNILKGVEETLNPIFAKLPKPPQDYFWGDIGCGSRGIFSIYLKKHNFQVLALDEESLDESWASIINDFGVEFIQTDANTYYNEKITAVLTLYTPEIEISLKNFPNLEIIIVDEANFHPQVVKIDGFKVIKHVKTIPEINLTEDGDGWMENKSKYPSCYYILGRR